MRLLGTKLLKGMGLGNMLFAYVSVRALAKALDCPFSILGASLLENALKDGSPDGKPFLSLDYGIDAQETDFHLTLHEKDDRLYLGNSKHDLTHGCYVSGADPVLQRINSEGGVLIYGNLQAEDYFDTCREEIQTWLAPRLDFQKTTGAILPQENLCLINIRGGEYTGSPELFLRPAYFQNAIKQMRKEYPDMAFKIITDDLTAARRILPNIQPLHFSTAGDYLALHQARYLILSNSSFAFFPAYTNLRVKRIFAPKYWARHNVSDGYWSGEQNIYRIFTYLDRQGNAFTKSQCLAELESYKKSSPKYAKLNQPPAKIAYYLGIEKARLIVYQDLAARACRSIARRIRTKNKIS